MTVRTQFFSNCAGVFEGGGVRGSAFAGAYAAATAAGISFVRVAGTSAGSIVAALIAAGATPEYVTQKLLEKDFNDFLVKPDSKDAPFPAPKKYTKLLTKWADPDVQDAVFISQFGGFFTSAEIEAWVEGMLKELLAPKKPEVKGRPVRFSDLVLPCTIVAADISVTDAQIWSLERTPNDDVARAVRCSSTIPFFFQPVYTQNHVMVDGGMLSNLPTFVFPDTSPFNAGRFSERVLAFRLVAAGGTGKTKIDTIRTFGEAIANTVVKGGTAIQRQLQPDVFTIDVPTGDIQATDFKTVGKPQKEFLYDEGAKAVRTFLKNERSTVAQLRTATRYKGYDERLLVYVQLLSEAHESVWISDQSSYWVWFAFPSLFSAIRRDVKVHFVTTPLRNDDTALEETQRRVFLHRMGVRVHIVQDLQYTGGLRDPGSPSQVVALSSARGKLGRDYEYYDEQVRIYSADDDAPVVESVRRAIATIIGPPNKTRDKLFDVNACPEDKLIAYLSKVPQYRNSRLRVEDVRLEGNIKLTQHSVKEYKFMQIDSLIAEFRKTGIDLFHPQELAFSDGSSSIIAPPVFEKDGDSLVLIDGHTRALHCLKNNIKSMRAVIAEEVYTPLPGNTFELSQLRLSLRTLSISSNMSGYNPQHFRRIDEYIRPSDDDCARIYKEKIEPGASI